MSTTALNYTERQAKAGEIKQLRKAVRLTQADLALKAGVTVSTIVNIEKGHTVPRPSSLAAILNILHHHGHPHAG